MSGLIRRVLVGDSRAQAVALLTHDEEKSNINSFAAETLRGGDLGGDDAFGVAGAAAVDASGVLGRWDEGRDGVHVRGEDYFRTGLLRRGGINVKTVAFDGNSAGLVADAAELSVEIICDGGFVAGDGFDVDKLAGEGDCVHAVKRISDEAVGAGRGNAEVRIQNAEVRMQK